MADNVNVGSLPDAVLCTTQLMRYNAGLANTTFSVFNNNVLIDGL